MAQKPTSQQLADGVAEIAWSVEHIGRHLKSARAAANRDDHAVAQGCFDGGVLHLRAVLEFLSDDGDLRASYYAPGWALASDAHALGFDPKKLTVALNVHAFHLSKARSGCPAPDAWALLDEARSVLELFGRFLDQLPGASTYEKERRQELFDALSEARVQLISAG